MDNDLRRTIIIDNFQNPTNKKTIEDPSFVSQLWKKIQSSSITFLIIPAE